MKKLSALLAAALLLATPAVAAAQAAIDTTGLSEAQIAELQQKAEAARQATPEGQVKSTAAKVSEWAEIGTGIGTGLAAAARETGTVVNEFAATPVGKMTTAVIIYKVVGKDILGVLIGVPLLILFVSMWLFYTNRHLTAPWRFKYNAEGKVTEKFRDTDGIKMHGSDLVAMWCFSWLGLFAISAMIIGFIIF